MQTANASGLRPASVNMSLKRSTVANSTSACTVLFFLGTSLLGPTATQGSPMKDDGCGPLNCGPIVAMRQRRGYEPNPRPRMERLYQMSGIPLPPFQPHISQPQPLPQLPPRCPPLDALRQGTWSSEGGDTPSQSTGVGHGSQGGFYPPSSSFGSGQSGPQQGAHPGPHPGQGSGTFLPSSSYGSYDPWVSPSGQRPSGGGGMFGPRPDTGGHEQWSPASSGSGAGGPFRPPSPGRPEHSEYGPGTPTGYDQRPQGGRPPVELLGTGPSRPPTGDLGYPSPGSGIYGFDVGMRPPFYTPRTLTEGRKPAAMAQGPG